MYAARRVKSPFSQSALFAFTAGADSFVVDMVGLPPGPVDRDPFTLRAADKSRPGGSVCAVTRFVVDCETLLRTVEIQDEPTEGVLAPELQPPELTVSNRLPEQQLRGRLISTQMASWMEPTVRH